MKKFLAFLFLAGFAGVALAQTVAPTGLPVPVAGAYNSSPPTLTSGTAGWAQLDASGNLRVVSSGTPSGTQDTNVAKINGVTPLMGNGATGTGALRVSIASDSTGVVAVTSQYPSGALPITASATGTTGATTATLAAHATKTTYLCGFSIRAVATAAVAANSTVTGTVTGTLNFLQFTQAVATGIGITEPNLGSTCIPGSAANTALAVISAAPGSGGVISVSAWGYQL